MIGAPLPRRPSVQRLAVPFLGFLSGTIIIIGKADQVMIESLRVSVTDAASPILDALSRPLAFFGQIADRTQEFFNVYQDNRRLAAENERLLNWQQMGLKLASENARLREFLKLTPEPPATFI